MANQAWSCQSMEVWDLCAETVLACRSYRKWCSLSLALPNGGWWHRRPKASKLRSWTLGFSLCRQPSPTCWYHWLRRRQLVTLLRSDSRFRLGQALWFSPIEPLSSINPWYNSCLGKSRFACRYALQHWVCALLSNNVAVAQLLSFLLHLMV